MGYVVQYVAFLPPSLHPTLPSAHDPLCELMLTERLNATEAELVAGEGRDSLNGALQKSHLAYCC